MHEVVVEELRHKAEATACPLTDEAFVDALTASFLRVDAELATPPPPQPQTEGATDHRPAQALAPETVGSTSVVAIVSPKRIVVANTGDSRAVLSTGGKALPLSCDHKVGWLGGWVAGGLGWDGREGGVVLLLHLGLTRSSLCVCSRIERMRSGALSRWAGG